MEVFAAVDEGEGFGLGDFAAGGVDVEEGVWVGGDVVWGREDLSVRVLMQESRMSFGVSGKLTAFFVHIFQEAGQYTSQFSFGALVL